MAHDRMALSRPGKRKPIDRIIEPLQVFASHKLAGAGLLITAAVVALVWANSPWQQSYHHLLHIDANVGVGKLSLTKSVSHWINDGLMGVFFFLVGLEIKRELIAGELSGVRKAALPAFAAVGGMVIPAAIYAGINRGGPGFGGWGIPMATDIAFALGVLALMGDRVPLKLKVFLTALAIVDDIGAVLVIALFYSDSVSLISLAAGMGLFGVAIAANALGMRSSIAYFVLGTLVWLAFLKSGLHATIAGILMAFTIPARTRVAGQELMTGMEGHLDKLRMVGIPEDDRINSTEQQHLLDDMARCIQSASAPLQRLEHELLPVVTFVVLPVFALANAGVSVGGAEVSLDNPVVLGIIGGLLLGKPIGIFGFSFLAVKLRLADLPPGVSWWQLAAVSVLGGVGFTMALFVGGLAFPAPAMLDQAKIGILAASLLAAVVGLAALYLASQRSVQPKA